MTSTRVIPCLLLQGTRLVKTTQFRDPRYLGDPRNAVRIFNEKFVDELVLLDIEASRRGAEIQFDLIGEIVSEAFMPVAYGGGISSVDQAKRLVKIGVEKVILCSNAVNNGDLVRACSDQLGAQSVLVCLDVRRNESGKAEVYTHSGTRNTHADPREAAEHAVAAGCGEIVVNSIDRDGTMNGYDVDLLRSIANAVNVPVVACGGAGSVGHMKDAVEMGGAAAVAAGSVFVYYGKLKAVLISYPEQEDLEVALGKR